MGFLVNYLHLLFGRVKPLYLMFTHFVLLLQLAEFPVVRIFKLESNRIDSAWKYGILTIKFL